VVVLEKRPGADLIEGRWFVFAGVVLLLAAGANILWGVAAYANEDFFATNELLYGDIAMWATVLIAIALMECVTALMLFSGNPAGAYFGILAAGLNILGQLMVVGAYPIWSIIIIAACAVIIHALAIHCLPSGADSSDMNQP
jgi:hypothetical protein